MKKFAIAFPALLGILLLAGCSVPIPGLGGGNEPVPEINAEPAAVREYRQQVQPILEDTARDVAKVANVDVKVDGGNVSVSLDPNAAQQAEREARQGLEELRNVDPPAGLEDTHQRLIRSYEDGVPALSNFIAAVQSGDAGRISQSVQEDLPKIRRLLSDVQGIQQQLRQAGGQ